jgi:dipeptidyl aminopeptidase/acylaminoacyl peptidase
MSRADDIAAFLRRPRIAGLQLSPDGRRLVVGVGTPAPDGTRYRTALWEIDPDGVAPARQLTRSAAGESAAAFLPDGELLFTSARPDPDAAGSDGSSDPPAALWSLPPAGGEARLVFAPPAGVTAVSTASRRAVAIVSAEVYPSAADVHEDRARERARDDAGVSAQLFTTYPIRWWDSYLGPREPARWVLTGSELGGTVGPGDAGSDAGAEAASPSTDATTPADATPSRDAASRPLVRGWSLHDTTADVAPDGGTYVSGWRPERPGLAVDGPDDLATHLAAIDAATGDRRVLIDDGRAYSDPAVSPDGRHVICVAELLGEPDRASDECLVLIDLDTGRARDVAPDLDLWPSEPGWLPDGSAVVFTADASGHRPVFRCDLATDEVTRLTADGAYTEVRVSPDGEHLYALRAHVDSPHRPVRLEAGAAEQEATELPSPASSAVAGARVERLTTSARDGVEIGSWLVLPATASGPVPLVTFIHGGPLGSWNTWHWRWNPHVLADQGFAVLLPDPALSTGYGWEFIQRGWGRWGHEPSTDLLSAIDAAAADERIDEQRLAAAGGSFGGYMANWLAGGTDRFSCIVTHASLWALEGFHGTTDLGVVWEREFGSPYLDPTRFVENSPNRRVGDIDTPMLVIHGERDLRVPISEALTLWTDLARHGAEARFLYFPDENHWVLKPQNAQLWYETVVAFLREHLCDEPFERPELL